MKQGYEYNELVEKIAQQIFDEAINEKIAAEEDENTEREDTSAAVVPQSVQDTIDKIKGKKEEDEELNDEESNDEESKEAEEYIVAALEKAAAVYEEAEAIEKAAENAFAQAQLYKEASLKIFSDYGLLD